MKSFLWFLIAMCHGGASLSCDEVYHKLFAFTFQSPEQKLMAVRVKDFSESLDTYEDMFPSYPASSPYTPIESCQLRVYEALQQFSIQIESFIDKLQSFISETFFDFREFDIHGRELQNELSTFSAIADVVAPFAEQARRYNYAKNMFLTMGLTIESLKYFSSSQAPGHHLVWSAIDLYIRLFRLRNYVGEPNTQIRHYSLQIHRHQKNLQFLSNEASVYRPFSFGAQMVFDVFLLEAEKTLRSLADNIFIE